MPKKGASPAMTKAENKQARLANALRENLHRRKDRKRGGTGHGEGEGDDNVRRPVPPGKKAKAPQKA